MKTRRLTFLLLGLLCALVLVGSALGMSSDGYRLDWFTLLAGSGGGTASSTNYAINLTVGQTAIGTFSSTNYGACLGYWCGAAAAPYRIYLPVVLRNFS
jgi:hypothetical protein